MPESSDLDFLVEFEDLAPAAYADAYFGLQESLSDLYRRWIWWSLQPFTTLTSFAASSVAGPCSMQLEVKKYLYDIKQAADLLLRFSRGKTFADYSADPLLQLGDRTSVRDRRRSTEPALQN